MKVPQLPKPMSDGYIEERQQQQNPTEKPNDYNKIEIIKAPKKKQKN